MSQIQLRTFVFCLLMTLWVGPAATAQDNELSKGDRKWMEEEVGAIITTQEIAIFTDIDKKDRKLFKEIFWSRRDPNPATPENEFEKEFMARVKQADPQYKVAGIKGSATDMGKIFCLLGSPSQAQGQAPALTWVYEPDPLLGIPDGLTVQFQDGRMVRSDALAQELERAKTRKISNPTVMYMRDMDGRLMDARQDFDPNSPANKILTALRESKSTSGDVPFQTTISYFRATEGSIYIPVLFDMDDSPLTWDGDSTDLTLFGAVENMDGFVIYQFEEPAKVTRSSDGRTLYEIPLQLVPGPYKLYLGVRDNSSATVGTQIMDIEVPDYFSGDFVLSSVVVFNEGKDVGDTAGTPGHAYQFGKVKFRPARTFTKQDHIGLFYFVYGLGVGQDGKPNITGQYIFFRDGEKMGQTGDEPLQADAHQAAGIAEIPLGIDKFTPGKWTMQIKVTDHVLNQTLTEDVEFILGEGGNP